MDKTNVLSSVMQINNNLNIIVNEITSKKGNLEIAKVFRDVEMVWGIFIKKLMELE